MVAMSVAMTVDLTGQVSCRRAAVQPVWASPGCSTSIRGASMSPGGKVDPERRPRPALRGAESRIAPFLTDTAVVVPRSDVQHVVTEFGAVNLFGKSLQERALGLMSIAHPEFRDELFFEAKKMGLLGPERSLHESLHGVYPVHLEEVVEIGGEPVAIRPAKPVDERRIQEHFYSLEKDDVVARFFHNKVSFEKDEMEDVSQVDYINDLTLIAVVGEFGFGRVVAVGEYLLDRDSNFAEIAFSISRPYQRKGLDRSCCASSRRRRASTASEASTPTPPGRTRA